MVIVFPFFFGAVECGIRVAQQGFDAFAVFADKEAHADMGDDVQVFVLTQLNAECRLLMILCAMVSASAGLLIS